MLFYFFSVHVKQRFAYTNIHATFADEFLDVEYAHLADLYDMVLRGEIADAKTQIAVLKAAALRPEFIRREGK